MKKTKINPVLINLISILLFICFFVLLTQKLPIKVKKYLEDYKIQLLIILIILVISYLIKSMALGCFGVIPCQSVILY